MSIVKTPPAEVLTAMEAHASDCAQHDPKHQLLLQNFSVLRRPGGFCKVARPDPIPNSAVKRLRANGTMSQDLGAEVAARPAKDKEEHPHHEIKAKGRASKRALSSVASTDEHVDAGW